MCWSQKGDNIKIPNYTDLSNDTFLILFRNLFLLISLFFKNLFISCILFLAALGVCCCARAFSSCGEQGLLFVAVRRLLIAVASLVAEHSL